MLKFAPQRRPSFFVFFFFLQIPDHPDAAAAAGDATLDHRVDVDCGSHRELLPLGAQCHAECAPHQLAGALDARPALPQHVKFTDKKTKEKGKKLKKEMKERRKWDHGPSRRIL